MENVWEEKQMLSFVWESYKNTISMYIPQQQQICLLYTSSMGMIQDVHCSIFFIDFPIISWYDFSKSYRLPIWLFYKIQSEFIKALQEIDSHRVSTWLIYMGILWGQRPSVKISPIEFPFEALIENCETKAKLLCRYELTSHWLG